MASATLDHTAVSTRESASAVPWYVWCAVAAVTSSMVGVHWDISWHRSIGRDTFLTPAHIAIYLCGVLAGISCGYMILATTFGDRTGLAASSVRMWGFRGPLGAFIASWGGIAMLTSAPFDDWWHNAYGLDVRIISPPHTVLALGMFAVMIGSVLLVLGRLNRASGSERRTLEWMFVYLGGLVIVNTATFVMETTSRTAMHSAVYYRSYAFALPFWLVAIGRASGMRWGGTWVAAVYMAFWCVVNWILPLFPAEPKLGPVNNPVTHFVPSFFPVLLVIPALCLDLWFQRTEHRPAWQRGFGAGAIFLVTLVAVQWPFAEFLMSPASRNWFFFTNHFDYRTGPTTYAQRHLFYPFEKTAAEFWTRMGWALGIACLLSWAGFHWGNWLRKVRR